MRDLRKGGTIKTVDGEAREYFYYPERTAGDMIEIEKLASEYGGGSYALAFAAFVVCAMTADGTRLYPKIAIKEAATKIPERQLVEAVTRMGTLEEQPDPKA